MQFAIEVIFLCKKIYLMTLLKSWIKQQLHIQLFCMPSIIVRKRQAMLLCLQNNLNNKPYFFLKHSAHLKLPGPVHTKSVLILLLTFFSCCVSWDSRKELQPWGSCWALKVTDGDPAAGCHRLIRQPDLTQSHGPVSTQYSASKKCKCREKIHKWARCFLPSSVYLRVP